MCIRDRANSLNVIAEDISFDMQIKIKEYSQKLNGFILIYTFIAILAPVIILIMLIDVYKRQEFANLIREYDSYYHFSDEASHNTAIECLSLIHI